MILKKLPGTEILHWFHPLEGSAFSYRTDGSLWFRRARSKLWLRTGTAISQEDAARKVAEAVPSGYVLRVIGWSALDGNKLARTQGTRSYFGDGRRKYGKNFETNVALTGEQQADHEARVHDHTERVAAEMRRLGIKNNATRACHEELL